MEIILANTCAELTGTLSKKHGYYIQRTKSGHFVSRRNPRKVPADGHWRFICDLAEMAGGSLIADIRVQGEEVNQALKEAGIIPFMFTRKSDTLNAQRLLHFKSVNCL